MPCCTYLQCGLTNNKGGVRLFRISQKERRWVAFSCSLIKRPSSPLQFGQEENIPGHSFERRAY